MNFLDLFSGIGGFRLGLEQNGHTCVGHCEIDKYADKSYRAMHNVKENEWYANDITKCTDELIRDELGHRNIDIICGGFPCQAFSIAGKRRGFEDTRGTLFFDVCRFAKILRPKYLFLENVRGLLSHDDGNTFEAILCALADIGYDAEWEVHNTKRWLPQNRERIFIIGHARGERTRKIFPLPEEDGLVDEVGRHIANSVTTRTGGAESVGTYIVESKQLSEIKQIGNIHQSVRERKNPHTGRVYSTDGISPCLNTMGGGGLEPKIAIPICLNSKDENGKQPSLQDRVYDISGISCAVTTTDFFMPKIAIPVSSPETKNKVQNGRRFKEDGEEMFTLTTRETHGVVVREETKKGTVVKSIQRCGDRHKNTYSIKDEAHCLSANPMSDYLPKVTDGMRIRKLTPLECFRLQGFPDELFYKAQSVNSDSQLYKQAGNSVSVPVIAAIAKQFENGVEI